MSIYEYVCMNCGEIVRIHETKPWRCLVCGKIVCPNCAPLKYCPNCSKNLTSHEQETLETLITPILDRSLWIYLVVVVFCSFSIFILYLVNKVVAFYGFFVFLFVCLIYIAYRILLHRNNQKLQHVMSEKLNESIRGKVADEDIANGKLVLKKKGDLILGYVSGDAKYEEFEPKKQKKTKK